MTGVLWRETIVSEDMVDPLNELARLSGDDVYVKPIKGYGSYADNSNSADMDAGGGHVDINLVGLTSTQKLRLERIARELGFYADIREPSWYSEIRNKWITAKWQSHLHMLKKDTRDLSDAARKQLSLWYAGYNGLAGIEVNGTMIYDRDDGPREFLRQTWTQYLQKIEDEMPTAKEIVDEMMRREINKISDGGKVSIQSAMEWTLRHSGRAADNSSKSLAEVVALSAAVNTLALSKGVDPEVLLSQVDESVKEALSNLRLVSGVSDVPTT